MTSISENSTKRHPQESPNLHVIVHGLKARRYGDKWTARCPAHEDKNPSLSITQCNSKVLLHCHSGCTQAEVIAALRQMGLWPEPVTKGHTPRAPRLDSEYGAALQCAQYWRFALLLLADEFLEAVSPTDPDRRGVTAYAAQVRRASGPDLVVLFRAHRDRDPQLTAGMVHVARMRSAALQRRLAAWISQGMNYGAF
jgi:hypothetical protein